MNMSLKVLLGFNSKLTLTGEKPSNLQRLGITMMKSPNFLILKGGRGYGTVINTKQPCNASPAKTIYRELMRVAKKFPEEKNKKGREFRTWLISTIRERFKEKVSVQEPQEIEKYLTYANLELISLQQVQQNFFKEQYPRNSIVPSLVTQAESLLSNETQKKMRKYKWGTFDRLGGLFLQDIQRDSDDVNNNNSSSKA